MQSWFHFCNSKVADIERIWNRKLDQPDEPAKPAEPVEEEPTNDDDAIDAIFANFDAKKLKAQGRRNVPHRKSAVTSADSKESSELKE